MVRTQIQLTETQVYGLKKIAAARRLSVAEVIRQSVNAVLKASNIVDAEEQRKAAAEIVGRFASGKSDVSSNHDSYLAEAFRE